MIEYRKKLNELRKKKQQDRLERKEAFVREKRDDHVGFLLVEGGTSFISTPGLLYYDLAFDGGDFSIQINRIDGVVDSFENPKEFQTSRGDHVEIIGDGMLSGSYKLCH